MTVTYRFIEKRGPVSSRALGLPSRSLYILRASPHASYSMTWEELTELAATHFFTIQSHTFWHPNFKQEAKNLDQSAYAAFVDRQLRHSKAVLEEKLNRPVGLLAWPFGIYDPYLMNRLLLYRL